MKNIPLPDLYYLENPDLKQLNYLELCEYQYSYCSSACSA